MKDWSDCDGNYIVNMKNLFHEIEIILLFFSQRASRCRVWGCLGDITPPPSLVEDRSYLYQVVKCCLERENLLESFVTLKVWLSQGSPALQADISALWNNTGLGGIFSLEITLQGLRSIKRTGGGGLFGLRLSLRLTNCLKMCFQEEKIAGLKIKICSFQILCSNEKIL